MASKHTLELIQQYIDLKAENKRFTSRNEYLAWRCGLVAALLANVADQDSLIRSVLITEVKRLLK